MDSFDKIGTLSELEPYGQFSKWIEGHDVLVYRFNGEIKALSNICLHFGGPVGFHKLCDGKFTCLWHNFQYCASDGQCVYPANMRGLKLREYQVRVEHDDIFVQLVEDWTPLKEGQVLKPDNSMEA